jgi:hypothetical protein
MRINPRARAVLVVLLFHDTSGAECVDSPEGWVDKWGASCQSNCDDPEKGCYERFLPSNLPACTSDGGYGAGWDSDWGNFADYSAGGIDATQACCICGGGSTAATPTEAPTAPTSAPASTVCVDVADWVDAYGLSCQTNCDDRSTGCYLSCKAGKPCCTTDGDQGAGWDPAWGTLESQGVDGIDATQACCICGGGTITGTAVPTTSPTDAPTNTPTVELVCVDFADWKDKDGVSCQTDCDDRDKGCYASCQRGEPCCTTDGGQGAGWETSWGNFDAYGVDGIDATHACCVCGGGTHIPSTAIPTAAPTGTPTPSDCDDSIIGGLETDIDCGGGVCPVCAAGLTCVVNSDCESTICKSDGTCDTPRPSAAPSPAPTTSPTAAPSADPTKLVYDDSFVYDGAALVYTEEEAADFEFKTLRQYEVHMVAGHGGVWHGYDPTDDDEGGHITSPPLPTLTYVTSPPLSTLTYVTSPPLPTLTYVTSPPLPTPTYTSPLPLFPRQHTFTNNSHYTRSPDLCLSCIAVYDISWQIGGVQSHFHSTPRTINLPPGIHTLIMMSTLAKNGKWYGAKWYLKVRCRQSRTTLAPSSHHSRTTLAPLSHHPRTTLAPPSHHSRTTLAHSPPPPLTP